MADPSSMKHAVMWNLMLSQFKKRIWKLNKHVFLFLNIQDIFLCLRRHTQYLLSYYLTCSLLNDYVSLCDVFTWKEHQCAQTLIYFIYENININLKKNFASMLTVDTLGSTFDILSQSCFSDTAIDWSIAINTIRWILYAWCVKPSNREHLWFPHYINIKFIITNSETVWSLMW